MVHVLDATRLMRTPRVYATFLLYLMSELFEQLPEVGDLPVPKLCFFFDEAHLLFNEAPKALLEKVVQVVRLIRSKGVGVYFVTQQPSDVPEDVLAQLGNRIQHALRAATPQGQKAIRVAASTMASNPAFDTAKALPNLEVGEALVSVLDAKGIPTPVQRTFVLPPESRVGPIGDAERRQVMAGGALAGRYDQSVDRESAFEMLQGKLGRAAATGGTVRDGAPEDSVYGEVGRMAKDTLFGTGRRQGLLEAAAKSVARQAATQAGRELLGGGGRGQGLVQTAGKALIRQGANALMRGLLGSLKR
jgi:DNA helicase HerA-like ATPase